MPTEVVCTRSPCISTRLKSDRRGQKVLQVVGLLACPLHCDIWLTPRAENGADWGKSMWKSRTRKTGTTNPASINTHYRCRKVKLVKHAFCSLAPEYAEWKSSIYIVGGGNGEWDCARAIFCCSSRLWKSVIGYTSIQPGRYPSDPLAYVH